jgi:hypothetical protein
VPHGIVSGKGFAMRTRDSRWGGNIYEYDIDFWGMQHPHVIFLSHQSDIGHEKSIMHGELAQLITAMRNRAHEPEMMEVGEDEVFETYEAEQEALFPEGPPFVFNYEQRFPVCTASIEYPAVSRKFDRDISRFSWFLLLARSMDVSTMLAWMAST